MPKFTQSPLCSLFTVFVHSECFTNHSNHIHTLTPTTRLVGSELRAQGNANLPHLLSKVFLLERVCCGLLFGTPPGLFGPEIPEESPKESPRAEKKKAHTTTTQRKSFGELFWPERQTFQAGGGYKNPMKTRKTISTTEIFPLWTPFFFCKEKFCTGAGRCMLSFPQQGLP